MGPGVAQEYAATKDGPTIWEDHFYPEIVDPESGEPLHDGELGELVFTSLTKEAMPVVRYRTRDLTRLLPGTNGPMHRMAKITGRSDDMLIIRGVNVFPSQIEEQILRCDRLAPHYRIDLSRPRRMDVVTVHVESKPGCTDQEAESAGRKLREYIKNVIGISVEVSVCPAASLERSAGKAVRVRDLRHAD
jgi:phenylacetate-CoA ligase